MSPGWLSATQRTHIRTGVIIVGGVTLVVGMLWFSSRLGIPPVARAHEYCPGGEFSCPGTKFSTDPLSYVVSVITIGAMMVWTVGLTAVARD